MGFYRRARKYLFFVFLSTMLAGLSLFLIYDGRLTAGLEKLAISFGIWLPISFILFFILVSIFFPSTPFMALSGILFGFKYGLLYSTTAGFISAFLTFYISRTLGKSFVDGLLHQKFLDKVEELDEKMARHGFATVLVLRLLPIMPFNILNLVLGISKVKTKDYALGTILGLAPSNILSVYFGSFIVSLLR